MKEMIKNAWNKIMMLPTWALLLMFLFSAGTSIYALRHNNQTMINLRDKVYEADKNSGDINTALNDLRKYVHSHMNTNLSSGGNSIKPPIQLKYTYERLQKKEQDRVNTANTNVYTDAQAYCQRVNSVDFSGRNRVPCVQDYVTTHGAKANQIPSSLYKFDFVSPTWSPDLAGWSLVLSTILFILLVASFTIDKMVKSRLKPI